MKTLEVDLNKLSDEGILRFMKLKQEVKQIREMEIKEQNKQWMGQQPPKNTDMPPPPAFDVSDDEYDDSDYGDEE